MKIKYTLDLEDLVFYNLYFFDKSPGVQRRLKLQKLGISVFVITSSILLTYFTGLWYVFLSSGCVVLFYVFTSLVSSTKNQLEKSVRSYYESEEARKDFGEKEVELTETGISFPSEGAEGEVAYSEIFKI